MNQASTKRKSIFAIGYAKITPMLMYKLLLSLIWIRYTVFVYVVQVARIFVGGFAAYIFPFLTLICAIWAVPYFSKKVRITDSFLYLFMAVVVLLSALFASPELKAYLLPDLRRILIPTMLLLFVGLGFDLKENQKLLFWLSLASVVVSFVYQIYQISKGEEIMEDNMDAAYKNLPSIIYLFYYAFIKKKLRYWLGAIFGLLLSLSFGTRGAILCVLVFVAIAVLFRVFSSGSHSKKAASVLILSFLLAIFFYGKIYYQLAELLSEFFADMGMSTRFFDMILEENLKEDNGRNEIAKAVISAILEQPFSGYGIMGDRLFANNYSHNIALELWCQSGVFLGTCMLLFFVMVPIRAFFKTKSAEERLFVAMFMVMVFVKLMLTGTYLVEANLFFMLGMCLAICRQNSCNNT